MVCPAFIRTRRLCTCVIHRISSSRRLTKCQIDKLVGLAMLVAASVVFLYYTIWTLLMVRLCLCYAGCDPATILMLTLR
jgi:hypothetical protein